MSMEWKFTKPIEAGFYYYQNHELQQYHTNAVCVIQVSKYKNREGFHVETLRQITASPIVPCFSMELDNLNTGWFAGPLPEPYHR